MTAAAHARKPSRLRQAMTAKIVAAAEDVFAEKGFEGTSTADIASRAGLPKANIHYYFRTKEDLYRQVLGNILELWLSEADHWITAERLPRAALEGYIRAKLKLAQYRPKASRIYAGELLRGAPQLAGHLHIALRSRVAGLTATIDGWIAAGTMKPVSATHLLFCIWAMTQTYADFSVQIGAVLDRTALDDSVFETAAATICTLVLDSLMMGETA